MTDTKEDDKPIKTLTAEDIRLLKTVSRRPQIALQQPWPSPRPRSNGPRCHHACWPTRRHPPRPPPPTPPPPGPPSSPQYGAGPYSSKIKKLEGDIKEIAKKVNEVSGIKESDTGLAHPSRWDLVSDKQAQQEEHALQVGAGGQWARARGGAGGSAERQERCGGRRRQQALPPLQPPPGCQPPTHPPHPQVARCTKIIAPNTDDAKYLINIKQIAKFVVGLGEKVRGGGRGAASRGDTCM